MGLLGCASPRNARRSRRRSEIETREEKELGLMDEIGKPRKKRHSVRSKKEKLSLVPSVPSASLSPSKSAYLSSSILDSFSFLFYFSFLFGGSIV